MPKWRPNGRQNRLKNWKYVKKGMAKINAEIWCWKMSRFWFWDHFLARSQLPTAIYPHRALEKRKREVKKSFGYTDPWIMRQLSKNTCFFHKIVIENMETYYENWGPRQTKVNPRAPKVNQKEPKQNQKWANGNQKGTNGTQRGAKSEPWGDQNAFAPGPSCGPPQGRVGLRSQSACFLPACTLSPQ